MNLACAILSALMCMWVLTWDASAAIKWGFLAYNGFAALLNLAIVLGRGVKR